MKRLGEIVQSEWFRSKILWIAVLMVTLVPVVLVVMERLFATSG